MGKRGKRMRRNGPGQHRQGGPRRALPGTRPSNNNMQREERSFNEAQSILTTTDHRPALMLWTVFVTMVTEHLGGLAQELRNEMRAEAHKVAAYYPEDVATRLRLADEWNEIKAATPNPWTLVIAGGPSITLEFRLTAHGVIEVASIVPAGAESIRPFQYLPRSYKEAVTMSKGKLRRITDLICAYVNPMVDTVQVLQSDVLAANQTIEPEWWNHGGSRQSTRRR